jgi:hypothetical protein
MRIGGLAGVHEIARHGEHEVGVGAVHLGEVGAHLLDCDVRPACDQGWAPVAHVVLVELVRHLGPMAAGLRQHGGDHAPRRALDQVPDEGPADAAAQHHEAIDAEVIHQADMVVGIRVPRPVDFQRSRRLGQARTP